MPLHFAENTAVLTGAVVVEEAEPLATWLRGAADPAVDLVDCRHLHTAALQALVAAGVKVVGVPADDFTRAWILPLLQSTPGAAALADHPTVEGAAVAEGLAPSPAEDLDASATSHRVEDLVDDLADELVGTRTDTPAEHPAPEEVLP
ncbi:hypothetical protein [Kineococcus sp. SYSU DK003]|uniref:hypothetical protein n=1 Tax=Kineococcus sp. SYSU DK003 TaxID=3383124 RepID=UPI003D7CF660